MSVVKRTWDPNKTYDLTKAELQAIEERSAMRALLKAEWQKKVTSPYKPVGSYIFDPAIQRFISMRANYWPMFKPTLKNFAAFFTLSILPMGIFTYLVEKERKERDAKFRSGVVSYKNRDWKFI